MLSERARGLLEKMDQRGFGWIPAKDMSVIFQELTGEPGINTVLMNELYAFGYVARQNFDDSWHPDNDFDEPPYDYRLKEFGRASLEQYYQEQRRKKVEGIRYIITTVIAVTALIISEIAIAAELGLIQFRPA